MPSRWLSPALTGLGRSSVRVVAANGLPVCLSCLLRSLLAWNPTSSWVGAPFSKPWGFPGSPVVAEAWFPFAESSFLRPPPHPPHPGASEGLSPTLSWQPWGCLSAFLLNPNLKDRHCRGAGPGPSHLCKNPRARGSQNLPSAPGAWGPQLGQHLAEWRAFGLLSPPRAPLPRGPSSPHQSDAPPSTTAGAAHARPLLPSPPGRGWGCVPGLRSPVGQWGAPFQPLPARRWALGARASTCSSWGALVSGGRGKGAGLEGEE